MGDATGETNVPISDWTNGTLKVFHDAEIARVFAYLNMRVDYERQISDERDKRYTERWQAQEVASTRYQLVSNEFRQSLDDLSIKQATKLELSAVQKNLNEKVDNIITSINNLNSRLDTGSPDVRALQNEQASRLGRTVGSDKTIAYVITAISVLFGLYGIFN